MDAQHLGCLVNSISRFIHLVACQSVKSTMPMQKDYKIMVGLLKLLKPVLDEVIDSQILLDELLVREIEELDVVVNEARDLMEKWSPKMSKIHSVLQSEPLAMKVQGSSVEICQILCRLLQSSPFTSHLASVQHCMRDLQCLEQERISEIIEEALREQRENQIPHANHLIKMIESLGLTSNQELLMENVALEKEKAMTQFKMKNGELDLIDQIVDLTSHIRGCMAKFAPQFGAINGLPIPPYFRCPLSLGLMVDPVIVASGQTYERAFIQKWIDHGLTICPQTRQTLAHTNLIPNYTVKALIANWCEDNNISFFETTANSNNISPYVSPRDFIRADSFRDSLNRSNSTSRSSLDVGNGSQKQRVVEVSSKYGGGDDINIGGQRRMTTPEYDQSSPEQSYIHSRSESASSAISSIEYMPPPTAFTVDPPSECPVISSPSIKDSKFSPWLSKTGAVAEINGSGNHRRSLSLPFSDSGSNDLTTSSHVKKLVEDLNSKSNEAQTEAAAELRLLTKHNVENRIIIAQCGAIAPLVSLLYSVMKVTQEHAVTALLNLSINDDNKTRIAEAGAVEPLIHVLKSGNAGAKENSAATLFSLSVLEEYKIKIGRSGAVKALVDLLGFGSLRGKKDAATALFNLSIFHENKARIVQAGAIKYLIELMDPDTGMVDKAVALLANLSTIPEGRSAITREGGIPLLVEVVETGSQRGKENAASILLQLCISSHKFCSLVLQEGAVPPLVALSQSGTPRAKEKAQQILSHFRNQREGTLRKAKS